LPIVPLSFKRYAECVVFTLGFPAILVIMGCQGFTGGTFHEPVIKAVDTKPEGKDAGLTPAAAESGATTLSAGDRAVLARSVDKDSKGRSRGVWILNVDPAAEFRWHYPKLDEILARPSNRRPDFHALLSDADPIVATNAALVLARAGDSAGQDRLVEAIRSPDLPVPARCAAAEALGNLNDPKAVAAIKELLDQYGRFGKDIKSNYIPELHAELIRGLARHEEPGKNPAFLEALRSPSADVRLEALNAWTASREKTLPIEAVDLRTDGDYRIRAAAIKALASRGHPQAEEYITSALTDSDVHVRHAAIAALGTLGTPEALAKLEKMLKDQNDSIRAQAVSALVEAKAQKPVLEASGDQSWRVRRKVAEALASITGRDAAAAAQRLLDDNSAEVQLAVVRALKAWPLDQSGPILLAAMTQSAFVTRKAAAEQLAAQWPAAKEFPIEGPPERRAEVLKKLNQAFRGQFSGISLVSASQAVPAQTIAEKATQAQIAEVEQMLRDGNVKALADYGPVMVDALEQLHFDRKQFLPEAVYREALPKHNRVFAVLDQMTSTEVTQRRRAAEELAAMADKHPPGRLAIARLSQIMAQEQDTLVWQSAMQAIGNDGSGQAFEIAYAGIGHASAEVRRRACEHLAAHPDAAHVNVLIPALEDRDQGVICAAARALAATGKMPDTQPLRRLLGSTNEDVQMEAALALTRLGDASGKPALERLAYSRDPAVRAKTARTMGEFPDPAFTPILIHLLNDNLTVARAALQSLPKVAGEDAAQAPGQAPATTTEQMLRWKHWYARQSSP
jgi:HEAT repeat protein